MKKKSKIWNVTDEYLLSYPLFVEGGQNDKRFGTKLVQRKYKIYIKNKVKLTLPSGHTLI